MKFTSIAFPTVYFITPICPDWAILDFGRVAGELWLSWAIPDFGKTACEQWLPKPDGAIPDFGKAAVELWLSKKSYNNDKVYMYLLS